MLKGIPKILSPELLKVLMEMGHGDELVLADANFPSVTLGKRLIRCDGLAMPPLLNAVLALYPLDQFEQKTVFLMSRVKGDKTETPIWETYRNIVITHDPSFTDFGFIERFAFYERAKNAYAVVATGEEALYANIILKKGVIK